MLIWVTLDERTLEARPSEKEADPSEKEEDRPSEKEADRKRKDNVARSASGGTGWADGG